MRLGAGELIVLAVALAIIFSASRMGALGNALGQFVNSFRKASRGEGYVDGKVTKRIADKAGIEDAQVVDSHPPRKS